MRGCKGQPAYRNPALLHAATMDENVGTLAPHANSENESELKLIRRKIAFFSCIGHSHRTCLAGAVRFSLATLTSVRLLLIQCLGIVLRQRGICVEFQSKARLRCEIDSQNAPGLNCELQNAICSTKQLSSCSLVNQ